jgi:hypothetical protein
MPKKTAARALFSSLVIAATWDTAAATCDDKEFTYNLISWSNYCLDRGLISPTARCENAEARAAQKNIDWVLFQDSAAKNTYLSGLTEAQTCLKDQGWTPPYLSIFAILHAQRHNLAAQCSIATCWMEYTAPNAYYKKLERERRLPQPANNAPSTCDPGTDLQVITCGPLTGSVVIGP